MPRHTGAVIDPRLRARLRLARFAFVSAVVGAAVGAALTGCASSGGPGGAGGGGGGGDGGPVGADFDPVIAAEGPVAVEGTVLDPADGPTVLCLGAIAMSAPPRCDGPELVDWVWAENDLAETMSGTTWGSFAVTGRWDGTRFDAESRVPLALWDPLPVEPDPRRASGSAGGTSVAELDRIAAEIADGPFTVLGSTPDNGYLWVDVVYDDGSIQRLVDEAYGPDVVVIVSAMRDA